MIALIQLGTIDYATGQALQQKLIALRKENKIGDVLLLLEHKPVITLGRNAKAANVVASPELLSHRGVELFECDRGGDVTFHGPGQIVGYPIFNLHNFVSSRSLSSRAESSILPSRAEENDPLQADRSLQSRNPVFGARKHLGVVEFVRRLEDVLMRTCADFGIPTKRLPGLTGVWTDPAPSSSRADSTNPPLGSPSPNLSFQANSPNLSSRPDSQNLSSRSPSQNLSSRAEENDPLQADTSLESRDLGLAEAITSPSPEAKLAAIGIHISRFITSHGFALNVNNDLSYFNLIIPCGITSRPVTSMQKELGHPLDLSPVAESISRNFGVVFQSQILWVDTLDALLGHTVRVSV